MKPNELRSVRGFTLIELMVAISVFSISVLAFYGSFSRAAELRRLASDRTMLVTLARNTIERIENDLQGAADTGHVRSDLPLFFAPAVDAFSRSDDRLLLDFTTFSARGVTAPEARWSLEDGPRDRGDQARVRWELTEDGRLLRSELRPPAPILERDTPPAQVEFASGVIVFEQLFFDGREWLTFWDATESPATPTRLPLFIETRLVLAANEGEPFELVSTVSPAMADPAP
ncbi:MAG: type II secretion system protein J [Hyphomicrobiaceae bacterium]|jgi:type II secretion system protein J